MSNIYLRVKRRKDVFFIHIKDTETMGTLKEMISEITGQRKELIRLFQNDKSIHENVIYDDRSQIVKEGLKADDSVFMVFAENYQEDEETGDLKIDWEELHIPKPSEVLVENEDLTPDGDEEDEIEEEEDVYGRHNNF